MPQYRTLHLPSTIERTVRVEEAEKKLDLAFESPNTQDHRGVVPQVTAVEHMWAVPRYASRFLGL